tara:strand:+ start:591 stop:1061 length:471 start_codon:yes stop_codon:yes gene_type:complete
MKGLQLDNGTIKTFNSIPKSFGKIIGGFNTLNDTELEAYGFYNIVKPSTTESQELGEIEWDADNSVFTYPVQNKTFAQSLAELKTQKIDNLKHSYGSELAKTDWIIIRDQELGNTTDSSILSSRATLRSDCATHESSINGKTTKAQVVNYSLPNLI